MGANCTASGSNAIALGEYANASGTTAIALGSLTYCTGNYSAAFGRYADITNRATIGIAGDRFSSTGDAQVFFSALKVATTDATQTTLLAAGTNLVIPADTSWCFSALVIGRSDETDGNDSAAYRIEGCIARDESSNTALVGSITKTVIAESAGATAWDVTAEADDTNEALAIKVTGEAATNIRWVAKVDIAQVTYA